MEIAHDKKTLMQYAKELYRRFKEDEIPGLSAQLAYYFLLSLFPFFLFLVTLLGFLPISTEDVTRLLDHLLPEQSSSMIHETLTNILETRRGGLLSFGIIATIWSASNGVNAIIRALNKAYDVDESRPFWKARALSVLLTFGIIIAIVVTLALPVLGSALSSLFSFIGLSSTFILLWQIIRWALSLLILTSVFSALYHFAPNRRLAWSEVWIGAIFTALGWLLVSYGFSFYVSNFGNYSATYGSLGGVIILMIWFFLSAMIIIIGGELNASIDYVNSNKTTREKERHEKLAIADKGRFRTATGAVPVSGVATLSVAPNVPDQIGGHMTKQQEHTNEPLKDQLKEFTATMKEESKEIKESLESAKDIQQDVERWKTATEPNKARLKQSINELKQTLNDMKQNKQKAKSDQ